MSPGDLSLLKDIGIHLIPKWPIFKYSFVFLQVSPYRLALKFEIQKNIFP